MNLPGRQRGRDGTAGASQIISFEMLRGVFKLTHFEDGISLGFQPPWKQWVLIIEIGSTIILMVVEAQGFEILHIFDNLGGGFKYFLISSLLGEMIQFDN